MTLAAWGCWRAVTAIAATTKGNTNQSLRVFEWGCIAAHYNVAAG
jgi:hypothetical protein